MYRLLENVHYFGGGLWQCWHQSFPNKRRKKARKKRKKKTEEEETQSVRDSKKLFQKHWFSFYRKIRINFFFFFFLKCLSQFVSKGMTVFEFSTLPVAIGKECIRVSII